MAGLSIWHILLFLIIVVLLFGTSKLKGLGRDLGGAVKDFKDSVKNELLGQALFVRATWYRQDGLWTVAGATIGASLVGQARV